MSSSQHPWKCVSLSLLSQIWWLCKERPVSHTLHSGKRWSDCLAREDISPTSQSYILKSACFFGVPSCSCWSCYSGCMSRVDPHGPSLKVTWAFVVEVPLSPDCIMRHCDCQESQAGCQSPEQLTLMSRKHPVMLRACGPSFINCGFRSFAPILRHRWKPRVSWPLCPVSVSTLKLIHTKSILFTNGFFPPSHQ